jgi:arsenate reductase
MCSKSREGLQYLGEMGIDPVIIEYLKEPLSKNELENIVKYLGIQPEELIRKNEKDYKENFKGKELNGEQWIEAMLKYPKLIQRPIILNGKKAVIARPVELIDEIIG